MTIGKTIALTRWAFVGKVMSLLFNMLNELIITFIPRSKCLLISFKLVYFFSVIQVRSLLLFYLVVHNFFPLLYPFSWVVHTLNFVLQLFYYSVPNFPFDSFLSFISLLRFSSFSCFKCVHATAKLLQLCMTLCDPMDCSRPGFLVFHSLPELAQTHVH